MKRTNQDIMVELKKFDSIKDYVRAVDLEDALYCEENMDFKIDNQAKLEWIEETIKFSRQLFR